MINGVIFNHLLIAYLFHGISRIVYQLVCLLHLMLSKPNDADRCVQYVVIPEVSGDFSM